MAASVWDLVTYAQTLMHEIAHGGLYRRRQSALEADSGRKIPCHTGDSNPHQYCAWLFNWTLYQRSYPRPLNSDAGKRRAGKKGKKEVFTGSWPLGQEHAKNLAWHNTDVDVAIARVQ